MQFTRLRLNGFKSFVDPTDLVIHHGLTGVVGPNGCGKSNLLEALRWVMGENRPTAMRGAGMEDVIFAGSSSRAARHHAEVALVLDNGDRLAPAAFNDTDVLEITRRITRDAGSAYKVGAKDVRARDVQMLFADASTGAHSPALVRQGQISELINAKPVARRRILEEAAGISGLYQRRHEAELKLRGAEQNLLRVDDTIEQLASQISQLARQARQAARYRQISAGLRAAEGQLLYRRWMDADVALRAAQAALRERMAAAVAAERGARQATKAREQAEAALPAAREEEAIAAAVVQRLAVDADRLTSRAAQSQERIAALEATIAQVTRDAEREAALTADAGGSITALEAEAQELARAAQGQDEAVEAAIRASDEAKGVLDDREALLTRLTEDLARLAARHQSAERLIADSTRTAERSEAAANAARQSRSDAEARLTEMAAEETAARSGADDAAHAAQQAEAALVTAETTRTGAQSAESEARAALAEAEGATGALRAEVGALRRLVERDAGDHVPLLDQVQVAPGYEKAFGAALGDDLTAPVVEAGSGWGVLPDYAAAPSLPAGAEPLAPHVTAPPLLARRLAQVGVVVDGALQPALSPGQRLVSRAGDLWRWDGFTALADAGASAAALRLEQRNRLAALEAELAEAEGQVTKARSDHATARRGLDDATAAERAARDARKAADAGVADLARRLSRAEAERTLAEGRVESAGLAVTRHDEEASAARAALAEARGALSALGDLAQARAKVEDVKLTVEAARMTMVARRSAQDELRRDVAAREKRTAQVARDLDGWRKRQDQAGSRSADLAERQTMAEADLDQARVQPAAIAQELDALRAKQAEAETRRAAAIAALAQAETTARDAAEAERGAERAASDAREARAGAEAKRAAADEMVAAAAERISDVLDETPQTLLASLDRSADDLPSADALDDEVAKLKRQRDALGAVNLRAEEDAEAVTKEHHTLVTEKTDLEGAIATLRAGINALNKEGRERLLTAFDEVNRNFGTLFTHLFGGGEARLDMIESDDPLEAGLEILCQPPGKKLATLSLLSGGEQTLTALALIFAVFLANPAPICVLDEVDAPLDDANVGRFCDLLDEMTRRTQTRFLIITHHAVTMSRMDRLFGVTMQEQGVSQLVSVDLKKAESLVA